VDPRSEDPKLIIRVINFELVQPICPWYVNVTDRRTDGRLTIAIPRFALCALRGKNYVCHVIRQGKLTYCPSDASKLLQCKLHNFIDADWTELDKVMTQEDFVG